MHLPTRYATRFTAASISLLAVPLLFSLAVHSQEPTQDKPAPPLRRKLRHQCQKLGTESETLVNHQH